MSKLQAGERYHVVLDARGDSYTRGFADADFPYTSDDIDVPLGTYTAGPQETDWRRYNVDVVEAILEAYTDGNHDYGTTVDDMPTDHDTQTVSAAQGISIQPNADIDGVRCRLSEMWSGITRARLLDSDGDTIASVDLTNHNPGDDFYLIATYSGGGGGEPIDVGVDDTLEWTDQSDWDNARSRSRVVTRSIGARSGSEIWQGWDPEYSPVNDARCYWTMDDTSGDTCEDALNRADGTYVNSPSLGQTGLLGSNAVSFNGSNQYVDLNTPSVLCHSGSFSVVMGVRRSSLRDRQTLMSVGFNSPGDWSFEVRDNGRLYFYWVDRNGNTHGNTFHYGKMSTRWHYVGITFNAQRNTAAAYLDSNRVRCPVSSNRRPPPSRNAAIGRMGDRTSYYFDGQISDVLYFDRAITSQTHRQLYNVLDRGGHLTTETQTANSEAVKVETTASVPSAASCELTIHKNSAGGRTSETSETISVPDGEHTTRLHQFQTATGSTYWAEVNLDTNSVTRTAEVSEIILYLSRLDGSVIRTHDNGVYEMHDDDHVIRTR